MNKKKNQLKSAIVSTLLMTSKAIENSTLQQVNSTSLVNLNQGTGVNYTSPQQLSNLKKYLSPYNSHNYTGHYDPTKHTHDQNAIAIKKSIVIRLKQAKEQLDKVNQGNILIHESKEFIFNLIKDKKNGLHLSIEYKKGVIESFPGCKTAVKIVFIELGAELLADLAAANLAIRIFGKLLRGGRLRRIAELCGLSAFDAAAQWFCDHVLSTSNLKNHNVSSLQNDNNTRNKTINHQYKSSIKKTW